jgi:shikimate dehydrogenase
VDLYAVFGDPIAHSRSPAIHARFATLTGQSLRYEARRASADQFAEALADFRLDGGLGANITLPLKEQGAALCDSLSEAAHRAGAVNTLVRRGDGWSGDNTDGRGLLADLDRLDYPLAGARILVLGAGGAARGILAPLLQRGPAQLLLANRTVDRALHVAGHLINLGRIEVVGWNDLAGTGAVDLLINATAAGHSTGGLQLPATLLARHSAVYDLSYGAAAAAFLGWATAHGVVQRADGLGMLVEQAAESFMLWRGVRPPTAEVLAELRAELTGAPLDAPHD